MGTLASRLAGPATQLATSLDHSATSNTSSAGHCPALSSAASPLFLNSVPVVELAVLVRLAARSSSASTTPSE